MSNLFGTQEEYKAPSKKMRLQAKRKRYEEDEDEDEYKDDKQDNTMGMLILCGFLVMVVNNLMKYGHL